MRPGYRAVIGALALAVGAIACGGDRTGPDPLVGAYALQSIDGQPLPVSQFSGGSFVDGDGNPVAITAGTLTIQSSTALKYSLSNRKIDIDDGTLVGPARIFEEIGTYTRNGDAMIIMLPLSTTIEARIGVNTITMDPDGAAFRFTK